MSTNNLYTRILCLSLILLFKFSDLKAQEMKIGTNFWARVDWTGELPFKSDVDFNAAWNSGITDYQVNQNVWNEEFLEEINFYSVLRFMDWLPTNKSPIKYWTERRLPNSVDQTAKFGAEVGVAYEWMIDLCNRVEADIWLCMPHAADDDYVLQLANLVYANLDPKLKIHIEYSNEVWNFDVQGNYAEAQGAQLGITKQQYVAHRSAQMWQIFRNVFGDEFESRVIKTLCGQATNSWIANEQLEYIYSTKNPTGLHPDVYGIAPYFGGNGLDANVSNIWQLLDTDIFEHRWDSANKASRIEGVRNNYDRMKSYDNNLKLVAYEGGQHIQKNATKVNFDPKMFDLYMKYLEAIDDYISVFVHYVQAGVCSDGNCWGAKEFTGQNIENAPKYRALFNYAKNNTTGNEIKKIELNNIIVYPNPVDSWITIQSSLSEISEVKLLSCSGRILFQKRSGNPVKLMNISTLNVQSGLYFLEIATTKGLTIEKVLFR